MVDPPGRIVEGTITYKGKTILDVERGDPIRREGMLSPREMREEILGNEIATIFQDPMESLNPVYTIGEQLREVIASTGSSPARRRSRRRSGRSRPPASGRPRQRDRPAPSAVAGRAVVATTVTVAASAIAAPTDPATISAVPAASASGEAGRADRRYRLQCCPSAT